MRGSPAFLDKAVIIHHPTVQHVRDVSLKLLACCNDLCARVLVMEEREGGKRNRGSPVGVGLGVVGGRVCVERRVGGCVGEGDAGVGVWEGWRRGRGGVSVVGDWWGR